MSFTTVTPELRLGKEVPAIPTLAARDFRVKETPCQLVNTDTQVRPPRQARRL